MNITIINPVTWTTLRDKMPLRDVCNGPGWGAGAGRTLKFKAGQSGRGEGSGQGGGKGIGEGAGFGKSVLWDGLKGSMARKGYANNNH